MSRVDMAQLVQDQALQGRQHLYNTIVYKSRAVNAGNASSAHVANMFCDLRHTQNGAADLRDPAVTIRWKTSMKRMHSMGVMLPYVLRTWDKIKGIDASYEPFFVVPNKIAVANLQAAREKAAASIAAKTKQREKEQQRKKKRKELQMEQQREQQRIKQAASIPQRPQPKLSKQQRETLVQKILLLANTPKVKQIRLNEHQKSVLILTYLQKRQAKIQAQSERGSEQNLNVRLSMQQPEKATEKNKNTQVSVDLQEKQRADFILSAVIQKQKQDLRKLAEQSSRNDMPPPPQPARRQSQSGNGGSGRPILLQNGQSGSDRPSSAQFNYPQAPNNFNRPAPSSAPSSNAMSSPNPLSNTSLMSNSNGAPSPKRQKVHHTTSSPSPYPISNTNANPSVAPAAPAPAEPEPKRKYAGRGRPKKNTVATPVGKTRDQSKYQDQTSNPNQNQNYDQNRSQIQNLNPNLNQNLNKMQNHKQAQNRFHNQNQNSNQIQNQNQTRQTIGTAPGNVDRSMTTAVATHAQNGTMNSAMRNNTPSGNQAFPIGNANTHGSPNMNRNPSLYGSGRSIGDLYGHANGATNMNGNMNANMNPNMNGRMRGNGHGSGNGNGNGNGNNGVNNSVMDATQEFPHVEAAAKMVHYFQDKAGVPRAGDGRMQ